MLTIKAPNKKKSVLDGLDLAAVAEAEAIRRLNDLRPRLQRTYKKPCAMKRS